MLCSARTYTSQVQLDTYATNLFNSMHGGDPCGLLPNFCHCRYLVPKILNMSVDQNKMEVDQPPENQRTKVDPTFSQCGEKIPHNNNNLIPTNNHETTGKGKEDQNCPSVASDGAEPVLRSEPQSMIRKTTVLFKPYLDVEPQSGGSNGLIPGAEAGRVTAGAATSALGAPPFSMNNTFNHYTVSPSCSN